MSVINWPILYINDPLKGRPLFGGQIFVGIPDLDPEDGDGNPINSKQLNIIQGDGVVVPVDQPFILSSGGIPTYNGKPVRLDVDGNYSIKILDKLGAQKYYIENVFEGQPVTFEDLPDINPVWNFDELSSAENSTDTNKLYIGSSLNIKDRTTGNGGGAMWDVVDIASVTPNGFDIVPCVGIPTLALELRKNDYNTLLNFGGIGDSDGTSGNGADNSDVINRWLEWHSENNFSRIAMVGDGGFRFTRDISIPVAIHGNGTGVTKFYADYSRAALTGSFILQIPVNGSDFNTYSNIPQVVLKDISILTPDLGASFTSNRTGCGVWWKEATRCEMHNVFIRGFERGIDTSGASWSSTINKCYILDNTYGVWHYANDLSGNKLGEGVTTTMGNTGFNGGTVTKCEIQGNDCGVYYGQYGNFSVFHSINITYTNNIIEGNRARAMRLVGGTAKIKVLDNYFELNGGQISEFPSGTTLVDVVASGTPADSNPDLVHAHIAIQSQAQVVLKRNSYLGTGSGVVPDFRDVPGIAYNTNVTLLKCQEDFFNNYLLWGLGSAGTNTTMPLVENNTAFTGRAELNGSYVNQKITVSDVTAGDANVQSIVCNVSINNNKDITTFEKISFFNSAVTRSASFTAMTLPLTVISPRVVENRGVVIVNDDVLPNASARITASGELEFIHSGSDIPFNTSVNIVF